MQENEDILIRYFLLRQQNVHEIPLYYTCAAHIEILRENLFKRVIHNQAFCFLNWSIFSSLEVHERALTSAFRFIPANIKILSYHTHATLNVIFLHFSSAGGGFSFLLSFLVFFLCYLLPQIPRTKSFHYERNRMLRTSQTGRSTGWRRTCSCLFPCSTLLS